MTHTTDNPTPSPSTLAGFLTGGYHEDCPTASIARYTALDEDSRQQRFDEAFGILLDDSINLDDGLGEAGPPDVSPTSWMHTVMGRRAAEMLIRLEASYLQLISEGALEAAWAVIEACTGYVAVAVWLQEVQGFPTEPADELGVLEGIVQRVGTMPYRLTTAYAETLPAYEVMACAIEAEAMLIDRDDDGRVSVELDRLRTRTTLRNVDLLLEALDATTGEIREDIRAAAIRRDFDTLKEVLRVGIGHVYLRLRVEDDGEAEVA
jgi:hypothetical protein